MKLPVEYQVETIDQSFKFVFLSLLFAFLSFVGLLSEFK